MNAWYDNAVFYHIYPFGELKDRNAVMRLDDMTRSLVPYLHDMGFTAVYLGPVWKSSSHGYDTIDYLMVDERLGTNDDLYLFVKACHDCGIRVILDAVFNHVGPEFSGYRDVVEKKESSPYWQWFRSVRRHRQTVVDTMLSWFGCPIPPEVDVGRWPGSMDLFELNLNSSEVVEYLYDVVCKWMDWFHVDGLRLDVADRLPIGFLQGLRKVTSEKNKEFYLVGELTAPGVDYRERCGEGKCDGALNYRAMGAIVESLQEQTLRHYATCMDYEFGNDGRYQGLSLYGFLENHDTDRVASRLSRLDLHLAYALMFVSPGAPSVFYGGEWGVQGRNRDRSALRVYPCVDLANGNIPTASEKNIAEDVRRLIKCRAENPELRSPSFRALEIEGEGDFCPGKDIMAFRRSENILCVASRMDKTCDCVIHGCSDGVYKDVLNTDTAEMTTQDGNLSVKALPGWVRVLRKIA